MNLLLGNMLPFLSKKQGKTTIIITAFDTFIKKIT